LEEEHGGKLPSDYWDEDEVLREMRWYDG